MSSADAEMDALLKQAAEGKEAALEQLLQRNRERLKRMISVRVDPRLAPRIDPSDVVQESLLDAAKRLPDYLDKRPIAFYPWLRQIAWQRLVDLHRRHVGAERRSVRREVELELPDASAIQLVTHLVARNSNPSRQAQQKELRKRVRQSVNQLSHRDQEVLALLYLEQVSTREVSQILGITEKNVGMRHMRALARLRAIMTRSGEWS